MPLSPFKSTQTNRRSPQKHEALAHAGGFAQFSPHQKTALLDGEPKRCYNQGIAAGFYRFLALLIGTIMIAVMVVHFLLQVIQRFAHHICDDANAGYHKQKVRHGSHLLPVNFRDGMVSSPPLRRGRYSDKEN